MKADLLFELGTEELPPKALMTLSAALEENITNALSEKNLTWITLSSFAAPRRLALTVKGLDMVTPDLKTISWGPPVKIAFNNEGVPTKAAEAFAKKNNLAIDDLAKFVENDGQQDKLCLRQIVPGEATRDLLASVINQSLANLPIPKRMRWGISREEFVRPVQWAVLLFDNKVCEETILGLRSSNVSQGHRFLGKGDIVINSATSYEQQLHDDFVIADFKKRRTIIEEGIIALAENNSGRAVIDPELLDEVTALNEWPVPLLGRFDQRFLSVPAEALISSMKEHQKYFHLVDTNGHLLPAFVTVANINSKQPEQIVAGNERVIRPRLADAAFFYKNDAGSSLEERRESLKTVVFQEKLGSVYDKTERVARLAKLLASASGANPDHSFRAAQLSKSDLVSDMVGEFADLQGIMGRYYALNDGEHQDIAEAQLEQYLPKSANDKLPATAVGITLAIADKLDTLIGIFSIGQQPSGSRDPFALRRASLGILRIIIGRQINMDLKHAIKLAAEPFNLEKDQQTKVCEQVLTYILERFRAWYKEKGYPAEIFQSVDALNLANPLDIDARVKAVAAFSKLPESNDLAAANKRVSNILAKEQLLLTNTALKPALFTESAETMLASAIESLIDTTQSLVSERKYEQALTGLASLRDPVDHFFNDVMVMVEDDEIRNNRLQLLQDLRSLFLNIADIAKIAGSK